MPGDLAAAGKMVARDIWEAVVDQGSTPAFCKDRRLQLLRFALRVPGRLVCSLTVLNLHLPHRGGHSVLEYDMWMQKGTRAWQGRARIRVWCVDASIQLGGPQHSGERGLLAPDRTQEGDAFAGTGMSAAGLLAGPYRAASTLAPVVLWDPGLPAPGAGCTWRGPRGKNASGARSWWTRRAPGGCSVNVNM